jgi:endonuclease YncB( thermonuclease family)
MIFRGALGTFVQQASDRYWLTRLTPGQAGENNPGHDIKSGKNNMKRFASFILLACSFPILADTISGQVVGVSDGDTITVLDASKKQTHIRLAQIDAPEKRQDFGATSKEALSEMVYGKPVTVEVETTDRYWPHRRQGSRQRG